VDAPCVQQVRELWVRFRSPCLPGIDHLPTGVTVGTLSAWRGPLI
jgi:hypothetical protein